jgi:GNAT superfamily N-acetyltransferase
MMTADAHLCDDSGADPHVVEAWITGSTLARDTPPPVPDSGGFRVDVGWPQQQVRYVFPNLGEGLSRLAADIVDPWIFLKACVPPEAMRAVLPPRWVIQAHRVMMTCSGPMRAKETVLLNSPWQKSCASGASPVGQAFSLSGLLPRASDEYVLHLTELRSVSTATVLTASGEVAAIGRVVRVGDFAIYDRIETHTDHRRRGLGRAVMKALEEIARAPGVTKEGATQGVLVATAEGRALYESLGWQAHSLYTTAVIPELDALRL